MSKITANITGVSLCQKTGTIRILMKPDAEVLEEVVVTGMQKMDKRLFTGAATKLDAE